MNEELKALERAFDKAVENFGKEKFAKSICDSWFVTIDEAFASAKEMHDSMEREGTLMKAPDLFK